MPKVLISAGHTLMDPGDIFQDLKEAELTRKIAGKLTSELNTAGVQAMAVPLDLPLLQRIDWINNSGALESNGDVCLEIHINSGGGTGLEAWFRGQGNNRSEDFAKHILEKVSQSTGYKNNGAKSEFKHELGSLTFLNRTRPTTIILECLFIDNEQDSAVLRSDEKLTELAKVIAKEIKEFVAKPIEKKVTPPLVNTSTVPNFGQNSSPMSSSTPPTSFSSPGIPPSNPTSFAPSNASNLMQDREKRKEMINERYAQILGREPSQSDLNYFLNIGVTEDQLIKRMVESQEHVELVKAKQELAKLKESHEAMKNELTSFRAKSSENEEMVKNLNLLLQEKNKQLAEMDQALLKGGIRPSGTPYQIPNNSNQ